MSWPSQRPWGLKPSKTFRKCPICLQKLIEQKSVTCAKCRSSEAAGLLRLAKKLNLQQESGD